jgi:hypothetical protein
VRLKSAETAERLKNIAEKRPIEPSNSVTRGNPRNAANHIGETMVVAGVQLAGV